MASKRDGGGCCGHEGGGSGGSCGGDNEGPGASCCSSSSPAADTAADAAGPQQNQEQELPGKQGQGQRDDDGSWSQRGRGVARQGVAPGQCIKCKRAQAKVMVRQREPMCWDCIYNQVGAKFHSTARGCGLVEPGDAVVCAVSGGVGSMALLHFLASLRSSNAPGGRKEKGKVSFGLSAVYVDEGCAYGLSHSARQGAAAAVVSAVKAVAGVDCRVVALEDAFLEDSYPQEEGSSSQQLGDHGSSSSSSTERLEELLAAVREPTAREDLVRHLRDDVLRSASRRLGASKVALGTSATRCAITTIEWCCKGKGYALPGSILPRDARHQGPPSSKEEEPVAVRPLRDVASKELALICRLKAVPLCPLPVPPSVAAAASSRSINRLSSRFVEGLQERLPQSVSTILATSSRLAPFPFNALPPKVIGRRDAPKGSSQPSPSPSPHPLCPLCSSPLSDAELLELLSSPGSTPSPSSPSPFPASSSSTKGATAEPPLPDEAVSASCCRSCRTSIVQAPQRAPPQGTGSISSSSVSALLPQSVARRSDALRRAAAVAVAAAEEDDEEEEGGTGGGYARAATLCPSALRERISEFLLDDSSDDEDAVEEQQQQEENSCGVDS